MPRPTRSVLTSALAAALAVALVVVVAQRAGGLALALCVPAALGAMAARRALDARHDGLRLLAQVDPLTGLGNQRLLGERLDYEVARHRRHRRRFAVFVLDLDGFKRVNDRFGHAAGDEVLREVAGALSRAVREQDTVVRQGGDEFCVLAPETGWEEAEALAARLRGAVRRAVGGLEGMSVSVGFAVFPDDAALPEPLLERADAQQGEAKRAQRGSSLRRAA